MSYANTRFDYSLSSAWDLKWHGATSQSAPLNDIRAVQACLVERGLGFIVLSGDVQYDDGGFRAWFKQHRQAHGKIAAKRAHAPTYTRRSKPGFTATATGGVPHLRCRSARGGNSERGRERLEAGQAVQRRAACPETRAAPAISTPDPPSRARRHPRARAGF